jgi:hypothetical protein
VGPDDGGVCGQQVPLQQVRDLNQVVGIHPAMKVLSFLSGCQAPTCCGDTGCRAQHAAPCSTPAQRSRITELIAWVPVLQACSLHTTTAGWYTPGPTHLCTCMVPGLQ